MPRLLAAWRIWYPALTLLYLLGGILPPWLVHQGWPMPAGALYFAYKFACHGIPDRCFHAWGLPLALCHRCVGVGIGALLGWALAWAAPGSRRISPWWWLACFVPLGLDWGLAAVGIWSNTMPTRFVTGMLGGLGGTLIVLRALTSPRGREPYRDA